MNKPKSKTTTEARKEKIKGLFIEMAEDVYDELDSGKFPSVTFASRSVRNIVYDKKLQQFILGENMVKRFAGNIKHIRPFTQLLWLAYFSKKLVDEKRTSTLRDVFYSAQAFDVEFEDQTESDELITDLEVLLELAREDFNVYPEERSAIFGNMTVEYTTRGYEGRRLDLSSHPDGVMIGPALTTAEFVDTEAEIVLAIEKGGLFTRFIEEKVQERFKAILVNTAGQPPRSTRYLLRRLNSELHLPVGILCDADPWGAHIAMVIKSGSVRGDEPIIIKDAHGNIAPRTIGEFVDECIGEYGSFVDAFKNELCGAIPFEVLTVDETNHLVFRSVSAAIRHSHQGPMYNLKTASGRRVSVTPNHSVFTLRDGKIISLPTSELAKGDLVVIGKKMKTAARPLMVDVVKELNSIDEIMLPKLYLMREDTKSKYHSRRELKSISEGRKVPHLRNSSKAFVVTKARGHHAAVRCPARIWLTKKLSRLLGYYTSEGWVGFRGEVPCVVSLCFSIEEQDVIEDALDCINAVFPEIHVSRTVDEEGHAITLSFGGIPVSLLFWKLCGNGHAKKFVPRIMFTAGEQMIREYLKGCFGDGNVGHQGDLNWKFKNPALVVELSYLMSKLGILPSISSNGNVLMVTGRAEVEKIASVVLHEDDRLLINQYVSSSHSSSYLMPKAFPVVASGFVHLRKELGRHQYHDLRCRYTYERLCEVVRTRREGGVNRDSVTKTITHMLRCDKRPLSTENRELATKLLSLVDSDIAFEPIEELELTNGMDGYVYDISVPGLERFIGGRSGLLLHNSAGAAHLRELTTPTAKWLGVLASVTGDEPVIMELDGMIRNEEIGELYSRFSRNADSLGVSTPPNGVAALCCSPEGLVGVMPVNAITKHSYDGDLYEIKTLGGYRVKTTGNHSIQVFNERSYFLESRPVSTLSEGDLVAACFRVPNNQSVDRLNIAQLILKECPDEAEKIFVEGEQAKEFCNALRNKYEKKKLRHDFYQVLKRGTPKLSYFVKEGVLPTEGLLRLRYSRNKVPVSVDVTPEFGRLLGYHVAEGNLGRNGRGGLCDLTFGGDETGYASDAAKCIRDVFHLEAKVRRRQNRLDVSYGAKLLTTIYLKAFRTGSHAKSKQVPFAIFNAPNEVKIEFLRGCFRGDRVVNYTEGTRLSLKTVSRKLASDLTVILRQLGCVSYVWQSGDAFVVSCADVAPIQDVVAEITRKSVSTRSEIRAMPGSLVYPLRDEMRKLVSYGKKSLLHRVLFTNGGKTRVGYERLSKAFQMFELPVTNDRLLTMMRLVQNDVVLLPVKSIANLGGTIEDVYDMEVDGVHTFVGGVGGLVLHNSDIIKYKLPSDPLTEIDIKRLYELKADPRYTEKMWHNELDTFLKIKKKSEQEAFSRYGLSYIVDKYLPEKLETMKSM